MELRSNYIWMQELASKIPVGANVKILLRHSIRHTTPESDATDGLLLTEEGKCLAYEFGKNLKYNLGAICSSNYLRCVQTVQCILDGKEVASDIIVSDSNLSSVFCSNKDIASKLVREIGVRNSIAKLLKEENLPGFNPIHETANKILRFVTSQGNKPSSVDIFCTHDMNIAIVFAHLFNITEVDVLMEQWPDMLEGMIMWIDSSSQYYIVTYRAFTSTLPKSYIIK